MVFVCPQDAWSQSHDEVPVLQGDTDGSCPPQIWTFQWPGCRDMKQNMWASENQKNNVCVYSA